MKENSKFWMYTAAVATGIIGAGLVTGLVGALAGAIMGKQASNGGQNGATGSN